MDYEKLLTRFWTLRETTPLSCDETGLYLYLLHYSYKNEWNNPFYLTDNKILDVIIFRNLEKLRTKLKKVGLLEYKVLESTVEYKIIPLK